MEKYTIEVTFIETDSRCGPPHECTRTWEGLAKDEQDAKERCSAWFGFEQDGIKVLSMKVL